MDQEELLQSARKKSRENVDDEVEGWRDVHDIYICSKIVKVFTTAATLKVC